MADVLSQSQIDALLNSLNADDSPETEVPKEDKVSAGDSIKASEVFEKPKKEKKIRFLQSEEIYQRQT